MASRRTYQCVGVLLVVAGVMGKFGALLSCIPAPVLGGIVLILFGMIISLGLGYLESVRLHSTRNMVVLGVSFSVGMALPSWIKTNPGVINTGYVRVSLSVCEREKVSEVGST